MEGHHLQQPETYPGVGRNGADADTVYTTIHQMFQKSIWPKDMSFTYFHRIFPLLLSFFKQKWVPQMVQV